MSNVAPPSSAAGGGEDGPLLVVISGPSGVGKDAVLSRLQERGFPAHYTITGTTRPQRAEESARDSFLRFLSEEEFDRLLAEDGLLEHAEVYGYRYGVPKAPVREALARGQDVLMRVDTQGAASIKKLVPAAVLIFLAPPSLDELQVRIRSRGLDDDATIRRRLDKAEHEMAQSPHFDHVVVNERDRLDDAVDRLIAIISAERCRAGREPAKL